MQNNEGGQSEMEIYCGTYGIVMCNLHSMQTSITVIPVAIHSVTITNGLTSALFTHLQNKLDV